MIAKLEFDLSNPNGLEEYRIYTQAPYIKAALDEFDEYLRRIVKYEERDKWPDAEKIRAHFYEILEDNQPDIMD